MRATTMWAAAILAAGTTVWAQDESRMSDPGLTAVPGIRVGQFTLEERPTGCTVVLAEGGATGGVDVRGGAPATRETDLLRPENLVQQVHAVVLSGGSAYGLDSATGVMRYLEEQNVGFPVRGAVVPIVVGASLLDLGLSHGGTEGPPQPSEGDRAAWQARPGPDCGYRAAAAASAEPVERGNVGAGAGATVGKLRGAGGAMKGGLGSASIRLPGGLVVAALVAVNSVGDIVDPATGEIVAGVHDADGNFLDARELLRSGTLLARPRPGENTTIGVVATNARLSKSQTTKLAQMAHDGYARAIVPAHTPGDGDAIFSLATGRWEGTVDVGMLGALAAEAMADAVVDAARQATGLPGIPAARDLQGER